MVSPQYLLKTSAGREYEDNNVISTRDGLRELAEGILKALERSDEDLRRPWQAEVKDKTVSVERKEPFDVFRVDLLGLHSENEYYRDVSLSFSIADDPSKFLKVRGWKGKAAEVFFLTLIALLLILAAVGVIAVFNVINSLRGNYSLFW